ncbi:MAG: bifunctional precorrin-2 dehydrogenase/sirohydrochlorin ferrochelatase [Actinomycetota bacterium]|nr:bifunctional precorrin-2 dehydrogenase/sirohydrochlorin ferrochelatase [Actinomycetota bacterium]
MLFPLHLDLTGKRVLVVGAGQVGVRRARAAASCGADVLLVAPEAPLDLELTVERRAFRPTDLDGAWLVLSCTGVVDDEVAELCREQRIWCVRADDASVSDAWVPAVGRADDVVLSVTSGRDPRRSVALRDQFIGSLT